MIALLRRDTQQAQKEKPEIKAIIKVGSLNVLGSNKNHGPLYPDLIRETLEHMVVALGVQIIMLQEITSVNYKISEIITKGALRDFMQFTFHNPHVMDDQRGVAILVAPQTLVLPKQDDIATGIIWKHKSNKKKKFPRGFISVSANIPVSDGTEKTILFGSGHLEALHFLARRHQARRIYQLLSLKPRDFIILGIDLNSFIPLWDRYMIKKIFEGYTDVFKRHITADVFKHLNPNNRITGHPFVQKLVKRSHIKFPLPLDTLLISKNLIVLNKKVLYKETKGTDHFALYAELGIV